MLRAIFVFFWMKSFKFIDEKRSSEKYKNIHAKLIKINSGLIKNVKNKTIEACLKFNLNNAFDFKIRNIDSVITENIEYAWLPNPINEGCNILGARN